MRHGVPVPVTVFTCSGVSTRARIRLSTRFSVGFNISLSFPDLGPVTGPEMFCSRTAGRLNFESMCSLQGNDSSRNRHRVWPVRGKDTSYPQLRQHGGNTLFGGHIQVAGGLTKNQDGRLLVERAGQQQALLLST